MEIEQAGVGSTGAGRQAESILLIIHYLLKVYMCFKRKNWQKNALKKQLHMYATHLEHHIGKSSLDWLLNSNSLLVGWFENSHETQNNKYTPCPVQCYGWINDIFVQVSCQISNTNSALKLNTRLGFS
jgi:hypothetical protein